MPVNVDIWLRLPEKPVLTFGRHQDAHGDAVVRVGWSRSDAAIVFPTLHSAEQFARWVLRRCKESAGLEAMLLAKRDGHA